MKPALRIARRLLLVVYLVVAAFIALNQPTDAAAMYAIAQGAVITWVATGTWARKYRYAARTQTAAIAVAIITVIAANPGSGGPGLVVYAFAAALLHVAHVIAQVLAIVELATVSVAVKAARRTLLWSTYGVPLIIMSSPSAMGVGASAICALVAFVSFYRNGRRSLHAA